jgi:glutaredoxin-like protein NrdH
MTVTVYSKPACVQCTSTKKDLERKGIAYNTVDVTRDMNALDYVLGLGYQTAPVVVVEAEDGSVQHWGNYREDRIAELATLATQAA